MMLFHIFPCIFIILFSIQSVLAFNDNSNIVILITGCSTGIGKSAAEAFSADPSFTVWATMRDTSKSTLPTDRPNLKITELDVSREDSVQAAVDHIIQEDKHIDIVINNAGYGIAGSLEMVKLDEAMEVFNVNVWGVVRVLQAVLPHMRKQRNGYIINISSTSGIRGIPCFEFYTGSKFALEGITDSMRYSLFAYNISVTNVNAGPVKTAFVNRFGKSEIGGKGNRQLREDGNSQYLQAFTNRMVAGLNYRMTTPEAQTGDDIAKVLTNLVHLKTTSTRMTDIPFNIGSSYDSQRLLEEVKKFPTGWGGIYNEITKMLPTLPVEAEEPKKDEL
jgi:NAD(P)-dependent dehydrogenase (short-subunit alcohol dehydrogenase family)